MRVHSDFFKLGSEIKGSVIVTSPPWGDPSCYQISNIGQTKMFLDEIWKVGREMGPKYIIVYLYRSIAYILNL